MKIDASDMLNSILESLSRIDYIHADEIPNIDLYMDQVTTFMDSQLSSTRRYEQDKILTKTMINNYAKNNLLPPPVKKKYTKEHTLLLIFIYYFKNMLSFHDIEALFAPVTEEHFSAGRGGSSDAPAADSRSLEDIYQEIFSLEKEQMKRLKEDILKKFRTSMKTFSMYDDQEAGQDSQGAQKKSDQEYLQLFSFICSLGFDVYLKKQIMEFLIDQIRKEYPPGGKKKK